MAKVKKQKVKVHRFYKNFVCIMLILLSSLMIVVVGVDPVRNWITNKTLTMLEKNIDIEDIISKLSNSVSNDQTFDPDNLSEEELEKLKEVQFTFDTDYVGGMYFRVESYGDYNSKDSSFAELTNNSIKVKKYKDYESVAPINYIADKCKNASVTSYPIDLNLTKKYVAQIIPNYSNFVGNKTTDCFINKSSNYETNYSTTFYPDIGLNKLKSTSFSQDKTNDQENDYYNYVIKNYLSVDSKIKNSIQKFNTEHGLNANSPTIIEDVAVFLRSNYTYDLNVSDAGDKDRILYFLEDSKKGICNHFAGATTLIYRCLGIPSRYVTGFFTLSTGGNQEIWAIMGHAWSEVYVKGSGWIRIDNTASVDPSEFNNYGSSRYGPNTDWSEILDDEKKPEPVINEDAIVEIEAVTNPIIEYDGRTHSFSDVPLFTIKGDLPSGVTLKVRHTNASNVEIKDAKMYAFMAEATLVNENGENVTRLYDVSGEDRILSIGNMFVVTRRNISITTGDATYQLYDSPINTTDVSYSNLVDGHRLQYSFEYSTFTETGEYVNSLSSYKIFDENNLDVTSNYNITIEPGEIKIE